MNSRVSFSSRETKTIYPITNRVSFFVTCAKKIVRHLTNDAMSCSVENDVYLGNNQTTEVSS